LRVSFCFADALRARTHSAHEGCGIGFETLLRPFLRKACKTEQIPGRDTDSVFYLWRPLQKQTDTKSVCFPFFILISLISLRYKHLCPISSLFDVADADMGK
jgi:hypothetical protein